VQPGPRVTNAADLKFLQCLPQLRNRNFKSKCGIRNIELLVILWFPKFVLEVAATVHELRKRVTSVSETGRKRAGLALQKVPGSRMRKNILGVPALEIELCPCRQKFETGLRQRGAILARQHGIEALA
jgi:hypothetical protein